MSNAKLNASIEACEYVRANIDINSIIGVGTGTTVNYFIEENEGHFQMIEWLF